MIFKDSERNNRADLIDRYSILLHKLYSQQELETFHCRLGELLQYEPSLNEIATVSNNHLNYLSESYTPPVIYSDKKNLILILGNPAPESVAMKAMYAYEGSKGQYHRFWRVMDQTGVLRFSQDPDTIDPHEKIQRLYNMDYSSPFNVHIIPFYSLPTPPGGAWGGVAGVRKLFGSAFARVESMETERIQQYLNSHLRDDDYILAFQKDAYVALGKTQPQPPGYNYRSLLQQPTHSQFVSPKGATANLLCMLPTRLLHARCTKSILEELVMNGQHPVQ